MAKRITDKNGRQKYVWVNPDKERLERLKKALATKAKKPKIAPMIELEPLEDISEAEIERLTTSTDSHTLKELSKRVRDHLKAQHPNMRIYNPSSGSLICMSREGIDKTIHKYRNRSHDVSPETKRSLFYLDKLLKNAVFSHPKPPTEGHGSLERSDIYKVYYKRNGKVYSANIVVFVHKYGHKGGLPPHNFHYAEVSKIEIKNERLPSTPVQMHT
ncbi:MAG: hypothetical protein AAF975_07660 [Spirochaetota bacterium]